MDLNFAQLFYEASLAAIARGAEAVAASPWPFIGIVGLLVVGLLMPSWRRRATYRR